MTWRAINAAGQANGAPAIDYERFAAQYDAEDENGILHHLVDRFDQNGLVIKTNVTSPQNQMPAQPATGAVEKMAKSATSRAFK